MAGAVLRDLSSQLMTTPVAPIQAAIVVGRSSSCQIRYPSDLPTVSRQHARIFPAGSNWAIEDLDSRNGTFVDQQRVKDPVFLKPNSKIMLGWGGPQLLFTVETSAQCKQASSSLPLSGPTSPLSHTVLFPFLSLRKDVWEGGYLLPVTITAICGALIALANHRQNISLAQLTFSLLTCTLSCLGFYELCSRRKSVQFTLLIMFMMAMAAYGLIALNRSSCNLQEYKVWCSNAFTAIVGEELFKSLPILICLFWGTWFPRLWHNRMRIQQPLDGILIAGASATGLRLGQAISSSFGLSEFDLDLFSILLGLGPIAYSSLLGYCAGLFAPYARKLGRRWQKLALLLYGYIGAFSLKAINYAIDSLPDTGFWTVLTLSLSVSYALLCAYILYAYILKAKKLSERLAHF